MLKYVKMLKNVKIKINKKSLKKFSLLPQASQAFFIKNSKKPLFYINIYIMKRP